MVGLQDMSFTTRHVIHDKHTATMVRVAIYYVVMPLVRIRLRSLTFRSIFIDRCTIAVLPAADGTNVTPAALPACVCTHSGGVTRSYWPHLQP